jgi:3-deoxy-D-arabino-heptulosonate 7-phosphate (DAHP) synthase
MAVGQLLDYAYQARKKFGRLNKAILVRKKPHEDVEEWLRDLEISLIWPDKEAFRDNAKGRFI